MRNRLLLVCVLLACSLPLNAQKQDSVLTKQGQRIAVLEKQCRELQQCNEALQREVLRIDQRSLELSTKADGNKRAITQLADSMNVRLAETSAAIEENVAEVNKGVKKRSIGGIVIAVMLTLLTVGVFFLLRHRIAKKGDDIELLRARADDLNRQMVERMDKELEEIRKITEKLQQPTTLGESPQQSTPDHELVRALADRITFMEMTLYRMDSSVKGHKHLTRSIKQMKDNLLANGYEIVDMLGKDYVEGMKASPSFNDDDSLERGKRVITGITKPQINYKGQMIQAAQITVSQNI